MRKKIHSVIAFGVLSIAMIISSCKSGSQEGDNGTTTINNGTTEVKSGKSEAAEIVYEKDKIYPAAVENARQLNFEKIATLLTKLSGKWADEKGKLGEEAGLKLVYYNIENHSSFNEYLFYYGQNVEGERIWDKYGPTEVHFTPIGKYAAFLMAGADTSSGAALYFKSKEDYDNFIAQANSYGLAKDSFGSFYVPKNKTGKITDIESVEREELILSFMPRGLTELPGDQGEWYEILLGLDF